MFPRWPLSSRNLFQAASCRKLEPETPVAPWHEELHHIGESQSPRCQKMLQNCHWSYKIIKNCFLSNGTYWNILTTSYLKKKKTCVYIYICVSYIYHIYIYISYLHTPNHAYFTNVGYASNADRSSSFEVTADSRPATSFAGDLTVSTSRRAASKQQQ